MYKGKKIGVVVPAYNEEKFIAGVINTIPCYVDKVYAVNDCSTDKTKEIMSNLAGHSSRLLVVNRQVKGGVGAAIISGHKCALRDNLDIVAVMAGDGQMDPAILSKFLDPVIQGTADYAKGNRLSHTEHVKGMPTFRKFGNFILTYLTRIASGYWNISDPQNGYTAISSNTLRLLDLDEVEKGFAFENDLLVRLNVVSARVVDVPHQSIYTGQQSKINYLKFIITTSRLLSRDTLWRIWAKYIKR